MTLTPRIHMAAPAQLQPHLRPQEYGEGRGQQWALHCLSGLGPGSPPPSAYLRHMG